MTRPPYLDADTFRDDGYLQEVNRRFLHPLGLALEWQAGGDDDGNALLRVWDCRDDPEGIAFAAAPGTAIFEDGKAERVADLEAQRRPARVAALGYWIQPAEEASA
jgi:hypothetical protein